MNPQSRANSRESLTLVPLWNAFSELAEIPPSAQFILARHWHLYDSMYSCENKIVLVVVVAVVIRRNLRRLSLLRRLVGIVILVSIVDMLISVVSIS